MTSSDVKDVWTKWINSVNRRPKSRVLLPYLKQEGPDREYLLANLSVRSNDLVELDFSVEEFELIPMDEKLAVKTFDLAFANKNMPLLFALTKAYGQYGACCTFKVGTEPREIHTRSRLQRDGSSRLDSLSNSQRGGE